MSVLGENVKRLRERRGLSQTALAEALNVRQGSVSDVENGRIVRPRFIVELAGLLGVTPRDLNTPGFADSEAAGTAETTFLVRLSEEEWNLITHYRGLDPAARKVHRQAIQRASADAAQSLPPPTSTAPPDG